MGIEQDLLLVRVEVNLEEFPVFVPRKALRQGSYSFERTVEGEDGTRLDQKWTIISSSESTLPGILDQDIFIGVLELLERRGGMPESGTLEFSLYELAEILDVGVGGRTYADIKKSLERIALTSIRSENAFWIKGQKRYITDTFRLWDINFDESRNRKGEKRSRHRIEFGRLFMRSFQDHYLRGLDTELYWELDSPVAKRLYRLVDHKRDGSGIWEANLKELQRQIPVGPYRYPAKIREKLAGPHRELIDVEFLARAEYPDKERVRYEVAATFLKQREGLELTGTREELIAIQLLTHSGIRGDVARDLVAKHGPAHCSRYANSLPYQRGLRNPAGWLRKAIEQGYELSQTALPLFTDTSSQEASSSLLATSRNDHDPAFKHSQAPPEDVGLSQEEDPDQEEKPSKESLLDPQAIEAWQALVANLVARHGRASLPPWLEELGGGQLEGATLTILVPNSTAANYLNTHFGADLLRMWRKRAGSDGKLEVAIDLSSEQRAELTE